MSEESPRCSGLNPAKICSLRNILSRKVSKSRAVQMLVKLGAETVAADAVAAAGELSAVWKRRSNQANFSSQLGQTSGFKAIFRRATQRLDNCSPELLAVEVASFTYLENTKKTTKVDRFL